MSTRPNLRSNTTSAKNTPQVKDSLTSKTNPSPSPKMISPSSVNKSSKPPSVTPSEIESTFLIFFLLNL